MSTLKKKFKIDFFELAFLAEACIPPVPIARAMFWKELIDVYHEQLTSEERARLHEWLNRNGKYTEGLKEKQEDILCFEARYNPDNQYKVWFKSEKESGLTDAFLYNGKYYIASNRWIAPEYIEKTEKLWN